MDTQITDMPLREQLGDPATMESLSRLLARAGDVEKLIDRASEANNAADGLVATLADVVDEHCQSVNATGTSVDTRIGSLVDLFMKVTEPKTVDALSKLIDRLPELEQASRLLHEVPNLVAMATDILDEHATRLREQGIDVGTSISQGLQAMLWLGSRVSQNELDRLGFLLRSDVLDPHALEVVGNAATSLSTCQRDSCEMETPERIGVLGLLKAIRDPNVQKAIGFGVRFAKCFGSGRNETNRKQ